MPKVESPKFQNGRGFPTKPASNCFNEHKPVTARFVGILINNTRPTSKPKPLSTNSGLQPFASNVQGSSDFSGLEFALASDTRNARRLSLVLKERK